MAEHPAVNRRVASSSLARGAIFSTTYRHPVSELHRISPHLGLNVSFVGDATMGARPAMPEKQPAEVDLPLKGRGLRFALGVNRIGPREPPERTAGPQPRSRCAARAMRGDDRQPDSMFSYVSAEQRGSGRLLRVATSGACISRHRADAEPSVSAAGASPLTPRESLMCQYDEPCRSVLDRPSSQATTSSLGISSNVSADRHAKARNPFWAFSSNALWYRQNLYQ